MVAIVRVRPLTFSVVAHCPTTQCVMAGPLQSATSSAPSCFTSSPALGSSSTEVTSTENGAALSAFSGSEGAGFTAARGAPSSSCLRAAATFSFSALPLSVRSRVAAVRPLRLAERMGALERSSAEGAGRNPVGLRLKSSPSAPALASATELCAAACLPPALLSLLSFCLPGCCVASTF